MLPIAVFLALSYVVPGSEVRDPLQISGTGLPGTIITVTYEAQPDAPAVLGVAVAEGDTWIGGVHIDLAEPFAVVPLGTTNGQGVAVLQYPVPLSVPPAYSGLTLYLQAVSATVQGGQVHYSISPLRTFTFPNF